MFNPTVLSDLANTYKESLTTLASVEEKLNGRFVELEEPIRALILSVASGEPLLLIGPPGTGKSRLIRAFCGLLGLIDENDLTKGDPNYFEYLLTPFTEPSELFGSYNIAKAAKDGELERIEKNTMQQAKVVYLDDVFNGSSAILNSILTFLNERIFHDRGERKKVDMQCLFAATNQIPEASGLRAIFDRFVLRCTVDNVEARLDPIDTLLKAGWIETYSRHKPISAVSKMLDEMEDFRTEIITKTEGGELIPKRDKRFYRSLTHLVSMARQYGLSEMSNRRLVKMAHIMLIHRVYTAIHNDEDLRAGIALGAEELKLLPRYFLDHQDGESINNMENRIDDLWNGHRQ